MLNEFKQWEIILKNQDLLDINAALSEAQSNLRDNDYSIPSIDYEEYDIFNSVSCTFDIPADAFGPDIQDLLMDRGISSNKNFSSIGADNDENEAFGGEIAGNTATIEAIKALEAVEAGSDFLDVTRVELEPVPVNDYDLSELFGLDGVDIDSYDNASIKVSESDFDIIKTTGDWSEIFDDIERYAQEAFSLDISNIYIPDIHYKPSRSGMTLVKGGGHSKSKKTSVNIEYDHTDSRNLLSSAENHDSLETGESFNIPVRIYIENGELVLKANLSGIDFNDLTHMNQLSNMKSVLALIPRKIKVK